MGDLVPSAGNPAACISATFASTRRVIKKNTGFDPLSATSRLPDQRTSSDRPGASFGAAYTNALGDLLVAGHGIGSQQNLCSLELAGRMPAATEQCLEFGALDLAEFDPIVFIACFLGRGTHEQPNRMADVSPSTKTFTPKQGQYLAFIHLYTRLHRRPPAEADMQEYFRVSPPSVHQMVLSLERAGLIRRQPRTPRSIEILVDPKNLPELI